MHLLHVGRNGRWYLPKESKKKECGRVWEKNECYSQSSSYINKHSSGVVDYCEEKRREGILGHTSGTPSFGMCVVDEVGARPP